MGAPSVYHWAKLKVSAILYDRQHGTSGGVTDGADAPLRRDLRLKAFSKVYSLGKCSMFA